MLKRFLSMLLVLAMVLSFAPVSVVTAAGAVEASPKAGTHTDAGHGDDCGLVSGWTEWTDATSLPTEGQIVLMTNVQMKNTVVTTGDLTICLNGYVVTAKDGSRHIGTARNNVSCNLIICDCTAYEENGVYYAGALTGGCDKTDGGGGAVFVRRGGTFKLYDGRLTGNKHMHDSSGGGAVALQTTSGGAPGGKFYMYGGEISNNESWKADGTTKTYGGGIAALKGSYLEISGGKVSDNVMSTTGGAIYATTDAEVNITGGKFTGNETSSGGGAIYANAATVTVKDAEFSDNTGGSGIIGLYAASKLTLDNVTITGNTGKNGSAIYGEGSSEIFIKDSTITGNTGTAATVEYSAAVLAAKATVTLSGKTVIADNTTKAATVPDVVLNNAATDTLNIKDLTEGSRVVFATPKTTAPVDAKEVIALDADKKQTEAWQSGWVRYMDAEGNLKDVGLVGEEFVWGHYHGDQAFTALENAEQLIAGGHYYLASDLTLNKEANITNDVDVDLCLNGHTLTAPTGARVLSTGVSSKVTARSNIAIDDCTAYTDSTGVYHAGSITGANHTATGGVLYIRKDAVLDLYEGKITGNVGGSGGAIILTGIVRMHGGEISDNMAGTESSGKNGGAIYLNADSTFIMNGGLIKNNKGKSGGAIYMGSGSTVELNGGTITGNTASSTAGAIHCCDTGIIKLSGKPQVTNNTAKGEAGNLWMDGACVIQLNDLDSAAKVGVTLSDARITAGNMAFSAQLPEGVDPSASFSSDDGDYEVELKDNKLTLVEKTVAPPPVVEHKHNGCNDSACSDHEQITYQPWTDAKALPSEGNWYLATDVTVENEITYEAAANKTVNLCLNGYTVTQKAGTSARMYHTRLNAGVSISIADCTAKTEGGVYSAGKITGFVMEKTTSDMEGSVMYLRKGTTLELFDGIFENNSTVKKSAGVLMINGVFKMYDGAFVGNSTGGGDYNGGAIYLNADSQATITGGIFKNNAGKQGGAIYMARDNGHVVENVTFSGNTAKNQGGALQINKQKAVSVTLKNCTFENNTAGQTGGAVRLEGVVRMEDCTFSGNQGGKGAVYVLGGADLTLAGNNQITGNEGNLYLEDQETVKVESATGTVGVAAANPGRAISEACDDYKANFVSDNADYQVAYEEGKLWLVSSFEHKHCVCGDTACTEHDQVSFQPWNDAKTLPEEGSYCLLTDVTLSNAHNIEKDLTLCLHGHTVTTTAKKRLISTTGTITLTITDCTAKTEGGVYTAGKLTGGVEATKVGGGAVFVRKGGTLKLYEGILTGNKTQCDGAGGGAVMLQSGAADNFASFYMYGGEISGNQACSADGTADRSGGGIYAYTNAVFVMEGGAIKNNEAGTGGGIHANNAQLTISGEISGNTAANGGGVHLTNGATVKVDGKVNITGNTAQEKASNLCLDGNQKLAVGTLDTAAKIAVTGQALSYITESCPDYTANFLSDNAKYQIVYQEGAMYLDAAGNHKHCFCAATSAKCDHTQQTFVEWDDPTKLPTSGNYFLSVDVELQGQVSPNNKELNLCLNGHTIKVVKENTRAFYIMGDSTVRFTDCADKPGSITGGTKGAILTESNAESASLVELWNGIVTGNSSTSVGGAILIQGASTFNMYGGKVTGNTQNCVLKRDENGKPILDANGAQTVTSTRGGGGVGVYGKLTTFNLYGGEITGNKTTQVTYLDKTGKSVQTGGYGGGVYVFYGAFNMYGGKLANNTSERSGGGLFTVYATVKLENISITGNKSGNSGGAAYFSTGSKVSMNGSTISGNNAKGSGGGFALNGKDTVLTMQGGSITGNTGGSGGGVLVQSSAELTVNSGKITNNKAEKSAGGLYISTKSKLTLKNASVTNNVAQNHAGGVYLNKGTMAVTNSSVSYNTAKKNSGGGIKMAGGTLTASGMSLIGNKAGSNGGGITSSGTSVTENGVKVDYFVTCNLYGCTIADNESNGSGGGMLHQSVGTVVNIQDCTFTGNKAKSSGGGFYISTNVTLDLKDTKVIGNNASSGAGFRLGCKGVAENVVVADNKTENNAGGGVFVSGASCDVELKNLEIYGNEATSGGGLVVQSRAIAKITDLKVHDNKALTGNGGGVYVNAATVELNALEINNNEAGKMGGGLYVHAGSRINAYDLNIHHNKSVETGGGANLSGATYLTNCVIANNETAGLGGGVSTSPVSSSYTRADGGLRLIDCKILNNLAAAQGGAVYVNRGGPAELTNVEISGNDSGLEGGAIYADGKMKMKDVTITDNTSLAGKYAVYMTAAESDGFMYYTGYKGLRGTIVIKDNEGGGVYLAEGMPLVIEDQLGEGSYIPITLSDGVVTRRVLGVYHYEGGNLEYVLTAGNRSITEPEVYEVPEETQPGETPTTEGNEPVAEGEDNTLLYAGIGGIAAVLILAAVLLVIVKKKKSAKAENK